jgi:hypothetical protein
MWFRKGKVMKRETYFGTRLGDRSKVVNQVGLGHTNTSITDRESLVLLVRGDTDEKLLACVEDRGIGQRRVSDFIEGIGGVGDEFSQEDLLVGVEGVFEGGQQWARQITRRGRAY